MSTEEVAELEKICLESDVHLAEVAACHQILTLVLGEPAHVPPTAKERMYALVQGREAIPFRKAATANGNASAPTSADADADEMFLLGLPFYRRGSWLRWALPLAAVVLFTVVGVALWQSIHDVEQPPTKPRVVVATNPTPEPPKQSNKAQTNEGEKGSTNDKINPPPKPEQTPDENPSANPKRCRCATQSQDARHHSPRHPAGEDTHRIVCRAREAGKVRPHRRRQISHRTSGTAGLARSAPVGSGRLEPSQARSKRLHQRSVDELTRLRQCREA